MTVRVAWQLRRALILPMILLFAATVTGAARAADSAVVIMYHRFGETRYPTTSVTIEQLEAHIAELSKSEYSVRSLPEIVAALRAGKPLPENTVGISIDDAYLSVYTEAWPRLRKAKLPFTLFVATDPLDRHLRGHMTWDQLRELAEAGVTIGNHTVTHLHMPRLTPAENAAEINNATARFRAELGFVPDMIAYPYGEYSLAVRDVTRQAGFSVAFGQHSGVIYSGSDFMNLPRFAFNETYGDLGRLRTAAHALPLRTSDVTPADMLLKQSNNPPIFGFTVTDIAPARLSRLACYVSGQGKAQIERLGERRVEVRMAQAFGAGRTRINCTFPEAHGRWRWLGKQFVVLPH
jgi:peptidoglycan/xylan/chitin deacetylase (PgdA/CDA1 family)